MLEGAASGNLCLAASWPGQMRTVWNDHGRFFETYFKAYPGLYFTGDGCRRDEDGYYWITGRVDDVINVSGHRIGTAEVESSLVSHPKVAEAAVVGYPARHQGPGDLCLRHPECRRGRRRRAAQGAGPGGPPRHRRARRAGEDPVHAGASQDPLGQDHAPRSCARSPKARPTASATPRPGRPDHRRCAGRRAGSEALRRCDLARFGRRAAPEPPSST